MKLKKVLFMILNMILCFTMVTPTRANSFTNAVNNLSLTIEYKHENQAMEGVLFKLYKVADMTSNLEFSYTEPFKKYTNKIKLDNLDSSGWKDTAETLAAYVQYETFFPLEMEETNKDGIVEFGKNEPLSMGIYLIVGQKHSINGRTYSIMPSLVC